MNFITQSFYYNFYNTIQRLIKALGLLAWQYYRDDKKAIKKLKKLKKDGVFNEND